MSDMSALHGKRENRRAKTFCFYLLLRFGNGCFCGQPVKTIFRFCFCRNPVTEMRMKKFTAALLFGVVLLAGFSSPAKAEYPFDKPFTMIVPNAPGGAADIMMRVFADYFQKEFNITFNVVNKPGGGTAIGINEMLRARPDGYTFVSPGDSGVTVTPLVSNVGFTVDSLKPVTMLGEMFITFATRKDSGLDTWAKAINIAHTTPEKFVYATHSGISNQRLFMTYLMKRFHDGKAVRHTAYSSGHEVSTALLGNHVNAGFQTISNQKPYVDSGELQVVAIASPQRDPLLPDTPTFIEIYKDQLKEEDKQILGLSGWIGLFTSPKVPDERVEIFLTYMKKALEDKEVVERLGKLGIKPRYLPAKEFAEVIKVKNDLVKDVLDGRKSLD